VVGHGVGKTACLVGIALDDLLRGGHVLHVALDQSVAHARAFYDTVFDELTSSTHLEDAARVRTEVDRRRSIRSYSAGGFSAAKLREALRFEAEAARRPELVIVEGFDWQAPRGTSSLDLGPGRRAQAEVWPPPRRPLARPELLPAPDRGSAEVVSPEPATRRRSGPDHDSPTRPPRRPRPAICC
jgi:hypothetical protein